jgi:hypothetical protein
MIEIRRKERKRKLFEKRKQTNVGMKEQKSFLSLKMMKYEKHRRHLILSFFHYLSICPTDIDGVPLPRS